MPGQQMPGEAISLSTIDHASVIVVGAPSIGELPFN
jgi:hypothetical protein